MGYGRCIPSRNFAEEDHGSRGSGGGEAEVDLAAVHPSSSAVESALAGREDLGVQEEAPASRGRRRNSRSILEAVRRLKPRPVPRRNVADRETLRGGLLGPGDQTPRSRPRAFQGKVEKSPGFRLDSGVEEGPKGRGHVLHKTA